MDGLLTPNTLNNIQMKKIITFGFGILLVSSLFFSCKKTFLDETLSSTYAPTNTLVDSLGLQAGIVGLNWQMRQIFSGEPQGKICVMYVGTDMAISVQPEGSEVPYDNYPALGSADQEALLYWTWAYTLINDANFIIQAMHDSSSLARMSIGYRKTIEAEAKFYRAYAYNFLVVLYGGVPLQTVPISAPKTDYTRATVSQVQSLIISDLTFASTYLTSSVKTLIAMKMEGRIPRAAAQQLLAQVYLEANNPDSAVIQCNNVLSNPDYSLIQARFGVHASQPGDYYSDMFVTGNQRYSKGNVEVIWGIEQDYGLQGSAGGVIQYPGTNLTPSDQHRRVWVPRYIDEPGLVSCDSLGGRGIGRMRLSNWVIYDLYEPFDMRNSRFNLKRNWYYNTTVKGKPNIIIGNPVVPANINDTLFRIAPYTTKWNNYNPQDAGSNEYADYKDIIMMRLGETYLLLAEAQLMQGNTAGAATSLNVIRARAGASIIQANQVTLDFILDERARELLAEENRRMTLVRTGTLVTRTLRLNSSFQGQGAGITAKNLLLPIPLSEINLNLGAKLTQNPGY